MATGRRVLLGGFAVFYLGGCLHPYLPASVADVASKCLGLIGLCLNLVFWHTVGAFFWRLYHSQNPAPQTQPVPQLPSPIVVVYNAPATARIPLVSSALNRAEAPVDFSCPICLADSRTDTESEVVVLVCGHFFCRACITTWLKESNACPMCRRELFEEPPKSALARHVLTVEQW